MAVRADDDHIARTRCGEVGDAHIDHGGIADEPARAKVGDAVGCAADDADWAFLGRCGRDPEGRGRHGGMGEDAVHGGGEDGHGRGPSVRGVQTDRQPGPLVHRQDRGLGHHVDPAALLVEMLAGIEGQADGVGGLQQVRRAAIGGEGVHRAEREGDPLVRWDQPFGSLGREGDGAGILLEQDPAEGEVPPHILAQGLGAGGGVELVGLLGLRVGDQLVEELAADEGMHAGHRLAEEVAAVHREEHVSDAIESLPKPELAKRPNKPKKSRPSKNRVTQKKNDASHSAAVTAWEAECAEIDAANDELITAWQAENKLHLTKRRQKRGRPSVQKAYIAAMKNLQDDYYEAVGKPCGLLRVGPRLARKSTKEYAAEKKQAKRLAAEAARLEEQRKAHAAKEAELAARADELASVGAALAERKTMHKANVEAANNALEQERASFQQAKLADEKALKTKEKGLVEKEYELLRREAELTEAVEAMGEMFEAVETGEAEIVNNKLFMPRWPDIVSRMQGADRDQVSSPIRKLINGFTRLVLRLSKRVQGSDAPDFEDEGPRP